MGAFAHHSNEQVTDEQPDYPTLNVASHYLDASSKRCGEKPAPCFFVPVLPEGILERDEHFMTCDHCHRVYWEGSHGQRMQALLAGCVTATGGETRRVVH